MIVRQQLLAAHSRANADKVCSMVLKDKELLTQLMVCWLSDEVVVAQRASQVVGDVGRQAPSLLLPWLTELVQTIENPVHRAQRRNGVRFFSELKEEIPAELEARLIDLFVAFVADPKTSTATCAFAMQFVADRACTYPKAAKKLKSTLKIRTPKESPGFKNRASKVLQSLDEKIE